jgi:hypothetical protein
MLEKIEPEGTLPPYALDCTLDAVEPLEGPEEVKPIEPRKLFIVFSSIIIAPPILKAFIMTRLSISEHIGDNISY